MAAPVPAKFEVSPTVQLGGQFLWSHQFNIPKVIAHLPLALLTEEYEYLPAEDVAHWNDDIAAFKATSRRRLVFSHFQKFQGG